MQFPPFTLLGCSLTCSLMVLTPGSPAIPFTKATQRNTSSEDAADTIKMVTDTIPDPLKQRLVIRRSTDFQNIWGKTYDTEYKVKFLTTCEEEYTDYVAVFAKNELIVYSNSSNDLVSRYIFEKEAIVQDVEYMPDKNDRFGLVVGINCQEVHGFRQSSSLVLLNYIRGKLQAVDKLVITNEISCVRVLVDDKKMTTERKEKLTSRMQQWPHIIGVGCQNAHCFIVHFLSDAAAEFVRSDVEVVVDARVTSLTDALRAYRSNGQFTYTFVEGGEKYNKKAYDIDIVYVSSIGYICRNNVMLIGLSFGGIISVSLGETASINAHQYISSSPVNGFAYMEPHDDPHNDVWFCAVHDARPGPVSRGLLFALYNVSVLPQEKDAENTKTSDIGIGLRLMHNLPLGTKWVSLKTLVRERELKEVVGDSTLSTSQTSLRHMDFDRSLVFFSYENNKKELMAGVFDLNAYYYKRLVGRVTPDSTLAKQNPFLSVVYPCAKIRSEQFINVAVNPSQISRLKSNVTYEDQLFYPSNIEFSRIYAATDARFYSLELPAIATQTIDCIVKEIDTHLRFPDSASNWIRALGLVASDLPDFPLLLKTLVSYNRYVALLKYIKRSQEEDILRSIDGWTWSEVQKTKGRMDESIEKLFLRRSTPLSPQEKKIFFYSLDVYRAAHEIFSAILPVLTELGSRSLALQELKLRRSAAYNLMNYASCIQRMIQHSMLPLPDNSDALLKTMENILLERRSQLSKTDSTRKLNIYQWIAKMQRSAPEEAFWLNKSPEAWYPPPLHNLLATMLVYSFSTVLKRQVLIYYLIDYTLNTQKIENKRETICYAVALTVNRILDIKEEDVNAVYDYWMEDNGTSSTSTKTSICENIRSREQQDALYLLELPRKLNPDEEIKLKSLLRDDPYGYYKWQCYLMNNRRFEEVDEKLPIIENSTVPAVQSYVKCLPAVRRLRQLRKPKEDIVNVVQWSQKIKDAVANYAIQNAPSENTTQSLLYKARTPIPLKPRLVEHQKGNRKRNADTTMETSFLPSDLQNSIYTPPQAKRLNIQDEETPEQIDKNLPAEIVDSFKRVLQTPTSRARAAAAAEAHLSLDTTPENIKQLPAPTSILKSGKAKATPSPFRGKLRFDLPDSAECSVASPLLPEKLPQPDFDSDDNEEDEEMSIDLTSGHPNVDFFKKDNVEQEETFEDLITGPPNEPSVANITRSSEEQSDTEFEKNNDTEESIVIHEEVDAVAANPNETVEMEEQLEIHHPSPQVSHEPVEVAETESKPTKLVDYSFSDSTMNETAKSLVTRWKDESGLEHSLEIQPDSDFEEDEEGQEKSEPVASTSTSDDLLDISCNTAIETVDEPATPPASPVVSPVKERKAPSPLKPKESPTPLTHPEKGDHTEEKTAEEEDTVAEMNVTFTPRRSSRRRTISEQTAPVVIPTVSSSKRRTRGSSEVPSESHSPARRLFADTTSKNADEKSLRIDPSLPLHPTSTRRKKSTSEQPPEQVLPETPTRSKSRKAAAASKSPSRSPPKVTAGTRSSSRARSALPTIPAVEASPSRTRTRKASEPPKSPSRASSRVKTVPEPLEVVKPVRSSSRTRKASESAVDVVVPKSPSRTRKTSGSVEPPKSPSRSTRSKKIDTVEEDDGKKLRGVAKFNALLKKPPIQRKRNRTASDTAASQMASAAPIDVPATISEEPENTPKRRRSRSMTREIKASDVMAASATLKVEKATKPPKTSKSANSHPEDDHLTLTTRPKSSSRNSKPSEVTKKEGTPTRSSSRIKAIVETVED